MKDEIRSKKDKQNDKNNFSNAKSQAVKHQGKNKFILLLFAALIFYGGYVWGNTTGKSETELSDPTAGFIKNLANPKEFFKNTDSKKEEVDFGIFWEAWKEVDKKYVDEEQLNSQERVYGAVKGMVEAVGDPYSVFLDPGETKNFNIDMEGSFEGIGAELGVRDDTLVVISPISGMPAEKAGLKAGDKIFKIEGEVTTDMNINEAVEKIRGPKGTDVKLTIVRNGDNKTQDITITRDTIKLDSVFYEKKENNIAYVRITKFSEDTFREFSREAAKMLADDIKGIVLDLRNNPGGYLEVSVEMASKFLTKNQVVVREKGRGGLDHVYKTTGGDVFSEIPLVVLINEGSASASEILAGALRDNRGIKLIGRKSFGKGSVQQMKDFNDGSSLKITVAKWLTPSNHTIHDKGLEPDIEVEITDEDIEKENDSQLNKAMEELKKEMGL